MPDYLRQLSSTGRGVTSYQCCGEFPLGYICLLGMEAKLRLDLSRYEAFLVLEYLL